MNILKWLKEKTGKMSVNLMQAAGITAVVGAAGVAAISYLNTPTDNNAFMPPSSFEQESQVQYVSRGGAGQYASNGSVESSFHATQSDSIRIANRQFEREQQARALEESSAQPAYADDESSASVAMPKAYQVGGAGVDLESAGPNFNPAASMGELSQLNKNIPGLQEALQAASQQGGAAATAGKPAGSGNAASGQTAGQFTKASLQSGQGSVRAGSGGGVNNSFAIQDSGKNANSKDAAAAMAQAGNVLADAQAAMNKLQEGTRMRGSRANFGRTDGLGEDRKASVQGPRYRYGDPRDELKYIRKQSAAIAKNGKSANEAGRPFFASSKISGGITVDGEQVTTGQSVSSGDLETTDAKLGAIRGKLGSIQKENEERTKRRHDLRKWMWWALPLALVTIPLIGAFATIGRMGIPFVSAIAWACAGVLAALTLWPTIKLLAAGIKYATTYGSDAYATMGMLLGGMLTAGVGVALAVPAVGKWLGKLPTWTLAVAAGIGFGGATTFKFLSEKGDGYTDEELDDNRTSDDIEKNEEKLRKES